VQVESTLIDTSGKEVVGATTQASVAPLKESVAKLTLAVGSPELWSLEKPTLYSVHTVVKRDGANVDEVTTQCGFRTIQFGFIATEWQRHLRIASAHRLCKTL
jgi:beta-galactosidase